jgi:hypothetical protein
MMSILQEEEEKNSFHFDEIKIFATEPAKGLLEF